MREKCMIRTKIEFEWDATFNKRVYNTLKAGCDLSGKGCKTAEEFKQKHTTKIEKVIRECNPQ